MKSRTVLAVLLPMAALFLLCTPFDLTLAGFFYAPSLFPARLLAALGDCPLYLALCALGWMLYFRLPERWKWTALPLVLLGAAAGGWRYAVHAAEGGFPLWPFPLVGVSEGLLPLFPAYRLRKRRGEGDVALLLCLLAALLLSLLLTHGVLKPLCGRMRYRDMAATGDFSGYTPWYRFHPFRL